MSERIGALGAVLQQHGMFALKGEDLEYVVSRLAVPVRIADGHCDRDPRSFLDELGRLVMTLPMMLLQEVDHLLAVASDRRDAVDTAARNAEPLPVLREELPERAR